MTIFGELASDPWLTNLPNGKNGICRSCLWAPESSGKRFINYNIKVTLMLSRRQITKSFGGFSWNIDMHIRASTRRCTCTYFSMKVVESLICLVRFCDLSIRPFHLNSIKVSRLLHTTQQILAKYVTLLYALLNFPCVMRQLNPTCGCR